MKLSRAIDGFLLHKQAEGRSPRTIADYRVCLRKLRTFTNDPPLADVDLPQLRRFFAHLAKAQHTPDGIAPRGTHKLSDKTIKNIHAAISSMYTWLIQENLHAGPNPMRRIARPKPALPPIDPLTQDQVVALIAATRQTSAWHNRPTVTSQRHTARRDRAIVLLLLDTGLRASEVCNLRLDDYDQSTGHLTVRRGKGNKGRTVRVERSTASALWRYLSERPDLEPDAPLFANSRTGGKLSRHALGRLLKRLGRRAGVADVYPHRFRHTFAIEFLRNNGDIYTLQQILGHTSLDMVRRYLKIVQTDLDQKHRTASPVKNWGL